MPAYQLTYNPAKSQWDGEKEDWWACYTKKVQPADEVYLLRLGQIPEAMKGIIGWGTATTPTYDHEGGRRSISSSGLPSVNMSRRWFRSQH
jgi:hypothetical protein